MGLEMLRRGQRRERGVRKERGWYDEVMGACVCVPWWWILRGVGGCESGKGPMGVRLMDG